MEFPITDLLDPSASEAWLERHFHPNGLRCPRCGASREQAHRFCVTKRSELQVYRCNGCKQTYNLYSGTIFQHRHLTQCAAVLLVRSFLKGEPSKTVAAKLGLHYSTVLELRHDLQANARWQQPDTPLTDSQTETAPRGHPMFQNAGKKRRGTP